MTPRRLAILAIAAVLVIAIGIWLTNRQSSTGSAADADLLYPDLKTELDSLTNVRIFKAGDVRAVEIVRTAGAATVTERDNYPADQEKLRKLAFALADAKKYEEKTSNPANYASLGVEDTTAATATGVRIELVGPAHPVNVIVGKTGGTAASTYVRRAGEATSWLVNAALETPTAPEEWLRKEIIDVTADRVQSATVTIASANPYTAAKASRADANFSVDGLAKGKELSAPSAANAFASALGGLTLADVQPAKALAGATPAAHATFTTFDGLVVNIDGWTRDGKHYIALAPTFDAALAERFKIPTTPPPAPGATTPAHAPEPKPGPDIAADAKTLAATLAAWVYEIPQYKYDAIFKPLDELLKKSESPSDLLKKKK